MIGPLHVRFRFRRTAPKHGRKLRWYASCRTRFTCQVACTRLRGLSSAGGRGRGERSRGGRRSEGSGSLSGPIQSLKLHVLRVRAADGFDPVQGATKAAKTAEKAAQKAAGAETASVAQKAAAATAAAAHAGTKPKAAEEVAHTDWCMHYGTRTSTGAFVDALSEPCASATEHALARALQPSVSEARAGASL